MPFLLTPSFHSLLPFSHFPFHLNFSTVFFFILFFHHSIFFFPAFPLFSVLSRLPNSSFILSCFLGPLLLSFILPSFYILTISSFCPQLLPPFFLPFFFVPWVGAQNLKKPADSRHQRSNLQKKPATYPYSVMM